MAYLTYATMKIQSATVAQPLVGSWVTAGAGFTAPCGVPITLTLGTQSKTGNDAAQLFTPGPAWLIDPNGANAEAVWIQKILNNTVTLGPQSLVCSAGQTSIVTAHSHVAGAFGTGTFILPKVMVNNVFFQPLDGDTGPLYLGNQYNFTADFRCIVEVAAVAASTQPIAYNSSESSPGNPFDTSELWVRSAAANDYYRVCFNQS